MASSKKEKKILKQTRKRCVSVGISPCCQMIKTFPFKQQTARDIFSSSVGQQIPAERKESQTKGHVENYSKQHSMLIHFTQIIWRMYLNRSLSEALSSSFMRRPTSCSGATRIKSSSVEVKNSPSLIRTLLRGYPTFQVT